MSDELIDAIFERRSLNQHKIKDKWTGEFTGRQKFSERVERRIAKGFSLKYQIAQLCIPRFLQTAATLFFEIPDPGEQMPTIVIKNPDEWPFEMPDMNAETVRDEIVRTPRNGDDAKTDDITDQDMEDARTDKMLAAELEGTVQLRKTRNDWDKFMKFFSYHPQIEVLTGEAMKTQFKNHTEFKNWCVRNNLVPLSEISERTGIKLEELKSQKELTGANKKIHQEILECCEAGHVRQVQHELCTEKGYPESNAQYICGLPLFLFMMKGKARDSLYMTALHSCLTHRMPKKPRHVDVLQSAQEIRRKVNSVIRLEEGTTRDKRANEMTNYLLLQDLDRHRETKWLGNRLRENPTWTFAQIYDWIASIDPKKDLSTGIPEPRNVREANFTKGNLAKVTCYHCNKVGHYKRDCLSLKKKHTTPDKYKKPKQNPHRSKSAKLEGNSIEIREVNQIESWQKDTYRREPINSYPGHLKILVISAMILAYHIHAGCSNAAYNGYMGTTLQGQQPYAVLVTFGIIWLYIMTVLRRTRAVTPPVQPNHWGKCIGLPSHDKDKQIPQPEHEYLGTNMFAGMLSSQNEWTPERGDPVTYTHCIWDSGASMHAIRPDDLDITQTNLIKSKKELEIYSVFGDQSSSSTWGKRRIGKFVLPEVAVSEAFKRGLISHQQFCTDNPDYSIITDVDAAYVVANSYLETIPKVKVGIAHDGLYHEIIPQQE